MYDAVGVDVETDFDLRDASGGRCDTVESEESEGLVVACKITLALQNMDLNRSLAVRCCGEDLALLSRDRRIAFDDSGVDASFGLNTEGQRGNVQKQQVFEFAAEHTALNGRADCDTLIGVDALEGFFAHNLLDRFLNCRHTAGTAYQEDLVQVARLQVRIAQGLTDRTCAGVYQVGSHLFELASGESHVKMFRAICVSSDEGEVDLGLGHAGQFDLRFFSCLFQSLKSHLVVAQIHAVLSLEGICHPVDDSLVEVIAAEAVIAGSCQHFLDAVAHIDDGNIESAAAEVEYHDLLALLFVHTISKCRGCRLIDDTADIQTSDLACVLRRLTLCVIEVSRNRDDSIRHLLAEIGLRVRFHLGKNHRGNLLRCIILAVNGHLVVGAHFTLDGTYCAVRVGDSLTLCNLSDDTLAFFGERHH